MKYLPAPVYRCAAWGDCSNDGISRLESLIFIQCAEGNTEECNVPERLRFRQEDRGNGYLAAIPLGKRPGMVGPSDGGNLACTSDSRLRGVYHIHDRWETQAQYDANFD
jgi:hypothetical protein